jgi:hypothetical protein
MRYGEQVFTAALEEVGSKWPSQRQGVVATQEFYAKTVTAAQDNAKALTEVAETAWGSTKMLNDKIVQNLTSNVEAAFATAQAMETAKSLSEIAKLQTDFIQKLATQATEQTKEFADLSARATQHVFEKTQTIATKSFKSTSSDSSRE